jgi:tellurite resistance protein TerC
MIDQITWIHWVGFIVAVIFFLALDLGVFHRKAHTVRFKEALIWTGIWATTAMAFAWGLYHLRGQEEAVEFVTGYIVELSLSMDNVFVMAMIFRYFSIPLVYQHRVLFWGILGALVMRGTMIGVGAALVEQFKWTLLIFGIFLVYSGIKMLFARDEQVDLEDNFIIKLARKWLPISPTLETHHFMTRINGRLMLTPLALVLVMVETTDLIFALDSIPAIFGITTKQFIIFTSNVFAILGLRSLYFVLAGAIDYFRFLKIGLSLVLVFIGTKMLLPTTIHLSSFISLGIVCSIILASVAASLIYQWLPTAEAEEARIEQK